MQPPRSHSLIALLWLLTIVSTSNAKAQTTDDMPRYALTLGLLQGGGALVGADIEYALTRQWGAQAGLGMLGNTSMAAGVNYHLYPRLNSPFVSLQYCQQGFRNDFAVRLIGPSLVYRGKKWFSCQIGFGKVLDHGAGWTSAQRAPGYWLTYAIGVYRCW